MKKPSLKEAENSLNAAMLRGAISAKERLEEQLIERTKELHAERARGDRWFEVADRLFDVIEALRRP